MVFHWRWAIPATQMNAGRWLFVCIYYRQRHCMEKKDYTGTVPGQYEGQQIDTESSVECKTMEEAQSFFETAKNRLLNVNHWHEVAGTLLAHFYVTDAGGEEVNRPVQKSDYFKIDIPGPGSKSGEGYDWVQVEAVDEVNEPAIQCIAIRVRPAPNPKKTTNQVSHFYSEASTSNFIVTREGKKLTAAIYDRNVSPNKEANTPEDKVRNTVAGAGAIAFFSKIQWKNLAEGLLKKEDQDAASDRLQQPSN